MNDADADEAERLDAELLERAGVDEAARAGGEVLREQRTAKSPQASVPQTPDMPCTATAPIGSSMPILSTQITPKTAMQPEPMPITIAAHGATKPEAAVIATSAPRAPFSIIEMSGLPSFSQAMTIPVTAPAAAAMFVVSRDVGEEAEAAEVDRQRRAGVEAEPAEPEDDRPEDGERDVVARDRVRAPVLAELADPRAEDQRAGQAASAPW